MAEQMKTKDFDKMLKGAGCSVRPGKGSHVVWYCPPSCGQHMITVTSGHKVVAPNAMRDVKYRLPCINVGV